MQELIGIIETQQKGHENEPIFMIGEQLKEMAQREPSSCALLKQDLLVEGMGLKDAAKKLQEYSDKNHGQAKCFCITPNVAERILREFYGLEKAQAKSQTIGILEEKKDGYIDLSTFL